MTRASSSPAVSPGTGFQDDAGRVSDLEVVTALIGREIKMRFGEEWFGFAAGYIAPLVWITAVYLAFAFFGRASPVYTDVVTFIISGLIPYAAFRYTVNAMGRARGLVRTLLIYPTVRRWHAMAATGAVELFNTFAIVAIVMGLNWAIFGNGEMAHPLDYAWGIVLSWMLGAGFGFTFVFLAEIRQIWWVVGQSLLRPSFFISAVFFTGNELPERLVKLLDWNPLLHAVEITRTAMLVHYESRIASESYLILCIAGLFAAGLAIRQLVRG